MVVGTIIIGKVFKVLQCLQTKTAITYHFLMSTLLFITFLSESSRTPLENAINDNIEI